MAATDFELLLNRVKTTIADNLNTKLGVIDTDKNDGITLAQVDSAAYDFQELQGAAMSYNPFVAVQIEDVETEGYGAATVNTITIGVTLFLSDPGDDTGWKRMLRYGRALQEVIEGNFSEIETGARLKVTSRVPDKIRLLNNAAETRVVGIAIQATIA